MCFTAYAEAVYGLTSATLFAASAAEEIMDGSVAHMVLLGLTAV